MSTVYAGAVHIHQGETFVVDELDLDDGLADPSRGTRLDDVGTRNHRDIGRPGDRREPVRMTVAFAEVEVTGKVIGYLRTLLTGEVLDSVPLDMPGRRCRRGPCCTPSLRKPSPMRASTRQRCPAHCTPPSTRNRSAAAGGHLRPRRHRRVHPRAPDTGLPTVFVYDGHLGGAGFAERGHEAFAAWIGATREAVSARRCASGCPSCVQSPKCGNGNEPSTRRVRSRCSR